KTLNLKVVNGRYEEPHTNMSFLYFDVRDVVFGRLSQNEVEAAAVSARYGSTTGNYYVTDTYVFGCAGGLLQLRAILAQDDIERDAHVNLRSSVDNTLKIRDAILEVTYEKNWTPASPAGPMVFQYKLVGGHWQQQRAAIPAAR